MESVVQIEFQYAGGQLGNQLRVWFLVPIVVCFRERCMNFVNLFLDVADVGLARFHIIAGGRSNCRVYEPIDPRKDHGIQQL